MLFVRTLLTDTADRDAEDIIQDVVYNLFEKGDISKPIEHLGAYIYRALLVMEIVKKMPIRELLEN